MELSEEEKKAIKIIEETHDMLVNPKLREEKYTTDDFEKAFYVVIMLIRKQQKEIEEKSTILLAGAEKVKQLEKEIEELKKQNYEIVKELKPRVQIDDTEYIERNFISKDKIREKIKEIESYAFTSKEEKNQQDYAIERIKDLLEEN